MRTSIKNLLTLALTFGILTTATVAVKADDKNITTLTEVKKVNKITVSGNVELYLVQSADENVKVYDSYYSKNALVQQKDGELRISSYDKETLTVVVYVSNLTEITATDQAVVRTSGKLQTPGLDVKLKGNASADLNINAATLTTEIKDRANLTLSGNALAYNGLITNDSKVNLSAFTAIESSIRSIDKPTSIVSKTMDISIAE